MRDLGLCGLKRWAREFFGFAAHWLVELRTFTFSVGIVFDLLEHLDRFIAFYFSERLLREANHVGPGFGDKAGRVAWPRRVVLVDQRKQQLLLEAAPLLAWPIQAQIAAMLGGLIAGTHSRALGAPILSILLRAGRWRASFLQMIHYQNIYKNYFDARSLIIFFRKLRRADN